MNFGNVQSEPMTFKFRLSQVRKRRSNQLMHVLALGGMVKILGGVRCDVVGARGGDGFREGQEVKLYSILLYLFLLLIIDYQMARSCMLLYCLYSVYYCHPKRITLCSRYLEPNKKYI